ncbi:sodium:calcium antiporter [Pseudogulbenkiania ferrooxidans]|uniref:Sodium/calcium exchanger membrane region n=1 Tax=Pseudogulbenkiania ferrooxidans 2002 TaxID=279714 RepID=B9Z450_9NEIS|nr:sodium:calcium antiporter [Pseudogulbenkiania ferrooxidans]EEG08627.1 sodium/calcium exchanger membrane region [Pseudogulbenkiania ferrooxidans 2002]
MLLAFTLFFLSAGAIYWSCEFFVNGVEWLGRRLNLGATAVGSVLAAFGTALPESAVTFTAVVFGNTPAQKDLGVGAAMGGPLVLATLAYAVVGFALMLNRRRLARETHEVRVDHVRLSRDQAAFLAVFAVKVTLGLVAFAIKPWLGVLFLMAYGVYVWREIRDSDTAPEEEELEPLKIRPNMAEPSLAWAGLQVVLALVAISVASHVFVGQLEAIGTGLHWSPHLVALLLSPVATELPETMNALIWVRQGKERLALANISGAMMIQATIPSALGIFFTPWQFDGTLLASGVITALAILFLWRIFRRGAVDGRVLLGVSSLYGVFALLVAAYFPH